MTTEAKRNEMALEAMLLIGTMNGYEENGVSKKDESFLAMQLEINETLKDYRTFYGDDTFTHRAEEELELLGCLMDHSL